MMERVPPVGGATMFQAFVFSVFVIFAARSIAAGPPSFSNIEEAPHFYSRRELHDPFTRFKAEIENGRVQLDTSSELAFLRSLLRELKVPVETQVLVFSTTSLQSELISPANPRALYFNDELYVGYIPRGKIEIISLDPDLGGIFYIFPVPRPGETLRAERSGRCMNCHSSADSRYMPGLVIESVIPAPSGGTLEAFRKEDTGHQIPYDQRFGGWYVTGLGAMTDHWGNLVGKMREGVVSTQPAEPGKRFDFAKYPVASSDLLAHLLLEHQAGFINRVLEATYRTRTYLHSSGGELTTAQMAELDKQARELVRYILFTDEPPLPKGGLEGDVRLKKAFLADRRIASNGKSLKDLDLSGHLFAHRCSYMIYSSSFNALPSQIKERVRKELEKALSDSNGDYPHLVSKEKRTIRQILDETIDWDSNAPTSR